MAMRFLLKLKHWQLFLITWGVPLIINFYSFYDTMIIFRIFPLMMILFTATTFGWIWSIATVLHNRLPDGIHLRIGWFNVFMAIPTLYIIGFLFWMNRESFSSETGEGESIGVGIWPIIVGLHLLSMVLIITCVRFAAKTMRSVELGRLAKFNDYIAEFFLIWFSPVGIWILQPRLNKLADEIQDRT
jgi:hypothetical protein